MLIRHIGPVKLIVILSVLAGGSQIAGEWILPPVFAQETQLSENRHLQKAKIYLEAGDFRRAIEACQRQIDHQPSVESYVFLAYVYEALDGYLGNLVKREDYVKVEQLSLNLTAREVIDLIDPPNVLPRMAQELIHEGVRQQFDITAAMANRLNKTRTEELWVQQTAWRVANPDNWWSGIPLDWKW
ncbi:MAG: hypothetical protein R3351_10090 [Nitrospirales bacterium]|nr:hypothetical protein [Nitrospirales bacterium]